MKRTPTAPTAATIAAAIIAIVSPFAALHASAQQAGDSNDCFPMCQPAAAPVVEVATPCGSAPTQAQTLAHDAEKFSDRIKPVKEIIGYVRSPQGLAMKLVNDHIVAIPAWVGYALDPVGSIKHRAMDEVRTHAKSAMGLTKSAACSAVEPGEPVLLPVDLEQV